jgi:hypothetical protein
MRPRLHSVARRRRVDRAGHVGSAQFQAITVAPRASSSSFWPLGSPSPRSCWAWGRNGAAPRAAAADPSNSASAERVDDKNAQSPGRRSDPTAHLSGLADRCGALGLHSGKAKNCSPVLSDSPDALGVAALTEMGAGRHRGLLLAVVTAVGRTLYRAGTFLVSTGHYVSFSPSLFPGGGG